MSNKKQAFNKAGYISDTTEFDQMLSEYISGIQQF